MTWCLAARRSRQDQGRTRLHVPLASGDRGAARRVSEDEPPDQGLCPKWPFLPGSLGTLVLGTAQRRGAKALRWLPTRGHRHRVPLRHHRAPEQLCGNPTVRAAARGASGTQGPAPGGRGEGVARVLGAQSCWSADGTLSAKGPGKMGAGNRRPSASQVKDVIPLPPALGKETTESVRAPQICILLKAFTN